MRILLLCLAFLSALIAMGCANPLLGAKKSAPDRGAADSARILQRYSYLPCNGANQGYDLLSVDPQELRGSFRIELVFSVAATQPCPYANILDINHRDRIGLVVQQDGTKTNHFVFGVGDGSNSYCIGYDCRPGKFYAAVFEKCGGGLRLSLCETDSLDSCNPMRAMLNVANLGMPADAYFLPGSYPTLGYNRNYGRYFNGVIYSARFYRCDGSAQAVKFDGSPNHSGNPALAGDPAGNMAGDFIVELGLRNELAQNDYATILDVNHRTNVGVVIQQNGSAQNSYCFGIGYGASSTCIFHDLRGAYYHTLEFRRDAGYVSLADCNEIVSQVDTGYYGNVSFLPGSTATAGYNANYGRYFNGLVSYAYVWTPVTGSR